MACVTGTIKVGGQPPPAGRGSERIAGVESSAASILIPKQFWNVWRDGEKMCHFDKNPSTNPGNLPVLAQMFSIFSPSQRRVIMINFLSGISGKIQEHT